MPYKDIEQSRKRGRDYMRERREDPKFRAEMIDYQNLYRLRHTPNRERLMIQRNNRKRLRPRGKQQCIHCEKVKPLDVYNFKSVERTTSGFLSTCRECENRIHREVYRPRTMARKAAS